MVKFIYECARRGTFAECNGSHCMVTLCDGTLDPEMACKDASGKPIVSGAYIVDNEGNPVHVLNADELHSIMMSGKIDLESYDIPAPSITNL